MLARLRRRFILVAMGLAGLVLLVVLAASIVSNYQAESARIEQALSLALARGPESWQRPWVGRQGGGPQLSFEPEAESGVGATSGGGAASGAASAAESGSSPQNQLSPNNPAGSTTGSAAGSTVGSEQGGLFGLAPESIGFIPTYVANLDATTLDITGENSDFISIDTALVSEALAEIESRLPQRDLLENEVFSGLLFDLRLFYRIGAAGGGVVVGTGNGTGNGTGATATNGPATTPTGPDIATIGPTTLTLALADASSLINSTLQMTGISALIWLGAMAVFFFISLLLSKIALRPVAEAWDRQRRFIADASHELKTPLTVILANNSLLLAHPNETVANQKRWILSTQAEAQRMDGLVRDLLLLARIDEAADGTANKGADKSGVFAGATLPNLPGTPDASGTPDVASRVQTPKGSGKASDQRKPRIDLSALVRRNLLQFEAVFFERGISLTCEVANGITVDGDEEQLGRLVQILLDNASKYAGEAKGNPAVWVGLQANAASQQRAILRVTNTGDPIAPAMLPHLFERFFRGDAAHSDTEGAGLGLSLAQAIVKAHNGSITVESAPQAGTTFTVSL